MDATTSPGASPSPASTLLPEPSSADAGGETPRLVSSITCPDCDGSRYVDDNAATLPCPSCDCTGTVCSWCAGKLHDEDTPLHRAGDCRSCLTTAVHRSTFPNAAAYDAAYDTSTWEGLARSNADQAERALRELADARRRASAALNEVAMLRSQLAEARCDVAAAVAKAKIELESARDGHRREVEDLQRQLRLASRRIVDLKTERAA